MTSWDRKGRVLVACETCAGSGCRHLTDTEERTRAAVGTDWTLTSHVLRRLPGVKATALCNRLVKLRSLGVVERRSHPSNGKLVQWRSR